MNPNFFDSPFNSIDQQQFDQFNSNFIIQNNSSRFFPPKSVHEEEEVDEDYNIIEDIENNKKIYFKDNDPSEIRISKKEFTDLIKEKEISQMEIENANKSTRKKTNSQRIQNRKRKKEMNDSQINQSITEFANPNLNPHFDPHLAFLQRPMNQYRGIYPQEIHNNFYMNQQIQVHDYYPNYYHPFSNSQLRILIKQRDIFLQLALQCLLLTGSTHEKYQAYTMLYNIINHGYASYSQIKYEIPFIKFKDSTLKVSPQFSIFQSPLLELIMEIKDQLDSKTLNSNQLNLEFKNKLFIDRKFLPIVERQSSNPGRKIFTNIDDHLLLIGLEEFGSKSFDDIQRNWIPHRATHEIKHRYKNLTCTKAENNIIKEWKRRCLTNLSMDELAKLKLGVEWFGTNKRWHLISKVFVPNRSAVFLEKKYMQITSACPHSELLKDYSEIIQRNIVNNDIAIFSIPDFIKIDHTEGKEALEWEHLEISKEENLDEFENA